jgi:hypothetical protein
MPSENIHTPRSTATTSPESGTTGARTGIHVVQLDPCECGALDRSECDCAEFAAQARGVFANPIFWDLRTTAPAEVA